MKYFSLLIILIFLQETLSHGQCDNLLPMYGDNCVKSEELKKIDEKFIHSELELYKTADSACKRMIRAGTGFFYRGDSQTAMRRFNQAWLLNSKVPYIYFWFGFLTEFAFEKNIEKANSYYNLGKELDKDRKAEKESLSALMTCLESRNDTNGLIQACSYLISIDQSYHEGFALKKRSYFFQVLKKYREAIEDNNRTLQIDPKDANSVVGRGFSYIQLGDTLKALSDFNLAIEMDPMLTTAYGNRANLYGYYLNNLELALKDITIIETINGENEFDQKYKADLLFKYQKKKEACDCYKKAINLGAKELKPLYKGRCK